MTEQPAPVASNTAFVPDQLPVAIFCDGRGTCRREETAITPKPLVKVGDYPILRPIMKLYHAQGLFRYRSSSPIFRSKGGGILADETINSV